MERTEGIEGVRFIDHTADVGIDVEAPSLEALFHRSALGMIALLRGQDDPTGAPVPGDPARSTDAPGTTGETRDEPVAVSGRGRAGLLVAWLKELLFLHESGWDYAGARFERLDEAHLRADVRSEPGAPAVREIKGVTYHGLAVEAGPGGWRARVIFDV